MKIYFYLLISLSTIISLHLEQNSDLIGELQDQSTLSEIEYINRNNYLELKSDYIITKISWTKMEKEKYKSNYLLGIFEGEIAYHSSMQSLWQ